MQKTGYVIRPFADVVAAYREIDPQIREQDGQHYDARTAFASADLAEWPTDPPVNSIYLMDRPVGYSEEVTKSAKALLSYGNFSAIGTWNAKGNANYALSDGEWILAEISLVQEQADDEFGFDEDGSPGDYVDLLLALFRVQEGWAAAVWKCSEREALCKIIGLSKWPTTLDQESEVWHGE